MQCCHYQQWSIQNSSTFLIACFEVNKRALDQEHQFMGNLLVGKLVQISLSQKMYFEGQWHLQWMCVVLNWLAVTELWHPFENEILLLIVGNKFSTRAAEYTSVVNFIFFISTVPAGIFLELLAVSSSFANGHMHILPSKLVLRWWSYHGPANAHKNITLSMNFFTLSFSMWRRFIWCSE